MLTAPSLGAEATCRRSLEINERRLSTEHPDVAMRRVAEGAFLYNTSFIATISLDSAMAYALTRKKKGSIDGGTGVLPSSASRRCVTKSALRW